MTISVLSRHRQAPDAGLVNWEPSLTWVPGTVVGHFSRRPSGVILHATRSGLPNDVDQEYTWTVEYAARGADGNGWSITVGDGEITQHMMTEQWGWNAREHSYEYLAAEFAQAQLGLPITDLQVRSFCWWFLNVARASWPDLPAVFPNHSDLPAGIRDGKTDVEPRGEGTVRERIYAVLGAAA